MISIPYIMTKKTIISGDNKAGVFQYGKGKIKTSDEQETSNGTSASRTRSKATHHNSSDNDCYADQETVRALTAALMELQREFRDKCQECQVLQKTVAMVSDDFIRSERNLLQANLRIEQLEFKMQAVSFWDWNDRDRDRDRDTPAYPTAVVENDLAVDAQGCYSQGVESYKKSPSKRSYRRSQRQRRSRLVSSSYEDDDSDEDTSDSSSRGSSSSLKRQKPKYRRDKSQDTDGDSDSESPAQQPPGTPRQAAFVRVMWERDLVQTQARQLTHVLLEKRAECFYLSKKLSKTTTLVELAYQDDDDDDDDKDTAGRPGSSDGYDLSWLTDDDTDSSDSSTGIHDDDPELTRSVPLTPIVRQGRFWSTDYNSQYVHVTSRERNNRRGE